MCEIRAIIAGSKNFADYFVLKENCDRIIQNMVTKTHSSDIRIIGGSTWKTDCLSEQYAKENGYVISHFDIKRSKYGFSAGKHRAEQMIKYASADDNVGVLIAFGDENSKKVKQMIDCAKKQKLQIHVVRE